MLVAWGFFAAWCVDGFPPCVDLPAHAAQIQTLADVIRGQPDVAQHYRASFPLGYGLTTWLFVPVALLTNGATAARLAVWLTLVLFPLGLAALARSFGRSVWPAVLGAPFIFCLSYWYGFLPTLWALPWILFGWAAFLRGLDPERANANRAAVFAVVLFSTLTMLSHVIAFGALGAGLLALALSHPHRRRALRLAGLGLLLPAALCGVPVVQLAGRAFNPQQGQAWDYDFQSHFTWIHRAYGPHGRPDVWICLAMVAVFGVAWWRRRKSEPRAPVALFLSLFVFFLCTPKSISGAWLVHVRLTVLVGVAALFLVELSGLPRAVRALLVLLALGSVAVTARRHLLFAEETRGIADVMSHHPPAGVHGGLSLVGLALPSSRITTLEVLGPPLARATSQ